MRIQLCVICNLIATCYLVNKVTKQQYPICKNCIEKKWYNDKLFDAIINK